MKIGLACCVVYVVLAAVLIVFFMEGGHGSGYQLLYYLGWPATIAYDSHYFEQGGYLDRIVLFGGAQWLVNGFILERLAKRFLFKISADMARPLRFSWRIQSGERPPHSRTLTRVSESRRFV
jgi:hypothetical protein